MSNGWDHAQGLADKHTGSGSGLFVRLANNGDKIVGAFVGEPHAREVHWGGERYEECTGDGCSFCGDGKRPSLRVSMNFFVPSKGDLKIIEGGVTWFKDLLKVRDKYGLGKWLFEIERHGEAGDPKTTLAPQNTAQTNYSQPPERLTFNVFSARKRRENRGLRNRCPAEVQNGGPTRVSPPERG